MRAGRGAEVPVIAFPGTVRAVHAGNRGISNGAWSRYQCNGGTWTNYDLWVN